MVDASILIEDLGSIPGRSILEFHLDKLCLSWLCSNTNFFFFFFPLTFSWFRPMLHWDCAFTLNDQLDKPS